MAKVVSLSELYNLADELASQEKVPYYMVEGFKQQFESLANELATLVEESNTNLKVAFPANMDCDGVFIHFTKKDQGVKAEPLFDELGIDPEGEW